MRKEIKKELKKKLTSDEMHIISEFVCCINNERQEVLDLYDWDEKKRIYILKENGKD